MRIFAINRIVASNENKIFLIAGPCQIESQTHAEHTAGAIKEICDDLDIDLVYKSSFDKANRSSLGTQRGIGIDDGLKILNSVKHSLGIPDFSADRLICCWQQVLPGVLSMLKKVSFLLPKI